MFGGVVVGSIAHFYSPSCIVAGFLNSLGRNDRLVIVVPYHIAVIEINMPRLVGNPGCYRVIRFGATNSRNIIKNKVGQNS